MQYSLLVEESCAVLSEKIGCDKNTAAEYIENVVFNTDVDLNSFFRNLFALGK